MERELLKAAGEGHGPVADACIAARARREDQAARAKRQHAARSFRMWPAADGMVEGHFKVTPEVGGAIKAVIDDGTRGTVPGRPHDRCPRITGRLRGGRVRRRDRSVKRSGWRRAGAGRRTCSIDHEALVRGHTSPGRRCEIPGVGPVSVEWVRQLLGTAFVTAIIKKGKDITTVAHLGRHIPAELRTAMIVSGRECSIEGCTGREYLELDHCEIDHANGGPTARWNLTWLCSIHHTRKTQGWTLGPPDPVTGKRRLDPPTGRPRG